MSMTGLFDTVRRKRMRRAVAGVIAAVTLLGAAACGSSSSSGDASESESGDEPISVIASINQWGSVAKELGGNKVNVTSIMTNTNVEAHEYEPTTSDISKFTDAKVVVVNGADYDPWASKAASATKATLVDAAQTGGKKSGDNPHVWFSADVRKSAADAITAAYEKALPDQKSYFEQQNESWHSEEQKLESKIADAKESTEGLPYAATESVAWYLAGDLGMTDKTPKGYAQASANESEPSPADIKEYQDTLASGSIKLLVFNTQEADSVTDKITSAAKEANVPIIELTEQMPQKYSNLLDWMTSLVDQFAEKAK